MRPTEYDAYREDIRKNGLRDKVVLFEGMILDKRHGYQACREVGKDFETEIFEESNPKFAPFFKDGKANAYDFVISTNIRRNLTIDQRACCGADYYPSVKMSREEAGKLHKGVKKGQGEGRDLKSHAMYQVADIFNVGKTTLARAVFVRTHSPDIFEQVKNGEVALVRAYLDAREMLAIKKVQHKEDGSSRVASKIIPMNVKIPSCFDSIQVIDNFTDLMSDLGWILEHKIKDRKHYGNFYGNGFPSKRDRLGEGIGEFNYRSCVAVAGRERLESINYPLVADAKL